MSSNRTTGRPIERVMTSARGRSPLRMATASASTSTDDDGSGNTDDTSSLRFDDEDAWSTSARVLHTASGGDDPYGTRHLESAGAAHASSFWQDELLVPSTVAARPARRSIDHGRSSPSVGGIPSASLPSTLAFHAFHRTPTTVWQAYRPAVDERSPTCSPDKLVSSTRPASSPSHTPRTQSPLATPFRGRFLALDLAPDKASEDGRVDQPSPTNAAATLTRVARGPASSPMIRSPPAVFDLRRESSNSSLSSQPDSPYLFNSIVDEAPRPIRWTRKGSTTKTRLPPTSKTASGRAPSPLKAQASTGFIKVSYRNGKALHSCEPCRKARHKCVGANPPPSGQAGVSEQPCQRCEARKTACNFEVLQTRGSSKRYKAVNARLSQAAKAGASPMPVLKRQSAIPHASVVFEPGPSRSLRSQTRSDYMQMDDSDDESDIGSDDDAGVDCFGPTRRRARHPTPPRTVIHTYIPDPVGHFPVYGAVSTASECESWAASLASSTRSDDAFVHPSLASVTHDARPRAMSLTSSSSDTDGLPLSPPSHHGPLPLRLDSTSGHCYPTSHGALPVGINTDAIGASHVGRQPSSDGGDSLRSLSAFVKTASRSREPSSSSTIVELEGSDEPREDQPVASPASLWTWFSSRQDAPPAAHAP